jgi:hypothetical protein
MLRNMEKQTVDIFRKMKYLTNVEDVTFQYQLPKSKAHHEYVQTGARMCAPTYTSKNDLEWTEKQRDFNPSVFIHFYWGF